MLHLREKNSNGEDEKKIVLLENSNFTVFINTAFGLCKFMSLKNKNYLVH